MGEQQWIVGLDPTRSPAHRAMATALAPRPASLDGAVIGLISNQKSRATDFLRRVYEELGHAHALGGQVLVTKATVSSPPTDDDWSRLREGATVAITGYGG